MSQGGIPLQGFKLNVSRDLANLNVRQAGVDEVPTDSTMPQVMDLEVLNFGILADHLEPIAQR